MKTYLNFPNLPTFRQTHRCSTKYVNNAQKKNPNYSKQNKNKIFGDPNLTNIWANKKDI